MPVEAKRIKERLKALFPSVNLSNKRLDELAARLAKKPADDADDTAVDQVINDANDFMPFADIAKEDDRVRNLEAKTKEKQDPPKSDENQPNPQEQPKPDEMPSWAKTMLETNQKLAKDLEDLKTGKITETKKENARKLFEQSETLKSLKETVKENWFNRIDVNSETSVEDQLKGLEEEYQDLVQTHANSKGYGGAPPVGTSKDKPSETELDEVADAL